MASNRAPQDSAQRPRIAVFSGPNATVLNSPPLVTSGRDVARRGSGALRPQRLAAPAVVYVEPLTAHPLEKDASDLYGPPDCLLDEEGNEHPMGTQPPDAERLRPVHRVVLRPEDGLYSLPYVATTKNGLPWEGSGLTEAAADDEQRQTFYPDASRLYEEIDRFGSDEDGFVGMLSRRADFEFFRPLPSGGYRCGISEGLRTDDAKRGSLRGAIPPESRGIHFFPYYPRHLQAEPNPTELAEATNLVQEILASGNYAGGQWLEGSPEAEETLYWFNLVLDITVPLVGHVAQRPHGSLSADGDRNIVSGVDYIVGRAWEGDDGVDAVGVVLIADQLVYAAREVAKTDARPGNYVATGGLGGIVGRIDVFGTSVVQYRPSYRFTYRSHLNLSRLPDTVVGRSQEGTNQIVRVLDSMKRLRPESMPVVATFVYGRYAEPCCGPWQVQAWLDHCNVSHPLAGVVCEGKNPYGNLDPATDRALRQAAFNGIPVVKCGRGATRGVTPRQDAWFISANNLTAPKARILLMAALLKFGAPPPATDPSHPSPEEERSVALAMSAYQEVFDLH